MDKVRKLYFESNTKQYKSLIASALAIAYMNGSDADVSELEGSKDVIEVYQIEEKDKTAWRSMGTNTI